MNRQLIGPVQVASRTSSHRAVVQTAFTTGFCLLERTHWSSRPLTVRLLSRKLAQPPSKEIKIEPLMVSARNLEADFNKVLRPHEDPAVFYLAAVPLLAGDCFDLVSPSIEHC
jgi:hypothetical protein